MTEPLRLYYTTATGPGATAAQDVPSASLGGYAATTEWLGGALHDLLNQVGSLDALNLRADYRCLYVFNPDTAAAGDVRVYLAPETAGAAGLQVGVDPRPATQVDSVSPQAVDVATAYTAPAGVTFSQPLDYAAGVALGALPAGAGRAVWLKRTPAATPPGAPADAADLLVGATGAEAVGRQLYWETAPYADATRPVDPPPFVPTPSPFRRVAVDFLTEGGARVTWELDRTLVDAGPYLFQLQASQSGTAGTDDWVDVGPPARDPIYLLDPDKRLWGMSSTLHYRVLLTTADAAYASPPANVFGGLSVEQWLLARELFRKERLLFRRFVGVSGFLLRARRYGPVCDCTDPVTFEVGDSACPACYGIGIVGGYHPAVPLTYVNADAAETYERVDYNESRGTVRDVVEPGRVLADVPIAHPDVWVALESDERYRVHKVKELVTFQSTPLVYSLELRMTPRSDVVYTFPVARPVVVPPDYKVGTTLTL